MTFGGVDWGHYQADAVTNSDFRKFDDVLRHILADTAGQQRKLTDYLDKEFERGNWSTASVRRRQR